MGSGGKKKKEENFWTQNAQTAYTNAGQKSELEKLFEQSQIDFLNWDKSGGKDVRDAPGLSNYIQIGQAAQERAGQERMGTGALQLGAGGGSEYAQKLKQLNQSQMAENFGTGLENALQMRRAEATGSVMPLASLDANRKGMQMQGANQMVSTYFNRPRSTPFWQQLLGIGAQAGASYLTGGLA